MYIFLNFDQHNSREKDRNAVLCIKMQGNSTYIADPAEPKSEPRKFTFDFSYWSHDGFKEEPNGYLSPVSPQYADQVKLCTVYDFKLFLCQFFIKILLLAMFFLAWHIFKWPIKITVKS